MARSGRFLFPSIYSATHLLSRRSGSSYKLESVVLDSNCSWDSGRARLYLAPGRVTPYPRNQETALALSGNAER